MSIICSCGKEELLINKDNLIYITGNIVLTNYVKIKLIKNSLSIEF